MSYVEDNLLDNEKVVYIGKVHNFYIYFFYVILLIGFLVSFIGRFTILPAIFIMTMAIYNIIYLKMTEIAVTNKRVLYKTGIIARNIFELQLNKLESARLDQNIFERIIGAGTLIVSGTGGHNKPIIGLCNPIEMKNLIYEQVEKINN